MPKRENSISINKKIYVALFILIFTALTAVLLYATERNIQYMRVQREIYGKFVIEASSNILQEQVTSSISDFDLLASSVTDIASNYSSAEDAKKAIDALLIYFSNFNTEYSNIALVSPNGVEISRVDINNSGILQDNSQTSYLNSSVFSKSTVLAEGTILVSIAENNIVDPTDDNNSASNYIILSTPLFVNGELSGILLINYDTSTLFDSIDGMSDNFSTNVDILDNSGFLISTTSDHTSYGFEKNQSFSDVYPQEWSMLVRNKDNTVEQIITDNGMFTYDKLDLEKLASEHLADDINVIFESPTIYLITTTLKSDGFENIFIDTSRENILYTLSNNFFYVGLIFLISSISATLAYYRQVSLKRIQYNSDYDSLANTYNRRAGMQLLRNMLNSETSSHLPVSICFLDINGLKEVNDILGHQFGDELIVTIANTINKKIHTHDIFMRVGGDEFVLVLKNTTSEEAESLWLKIMEAFSNINEIENRAYNISLSHGIIEYNFDDDSHLDEVLVQADAKMYETKKIIKQNFKSIK